MSYQFATLDDVKEFAFKGMSAEDRLIVPIEATRDAPFDIRRVFTIQASRADLVGGRHAHKQCSQLLVCLHGKIDVTVFADEHTSRTYTIDSATQGLLIPPGIWAEQMYHTDDTVLMVLCDRFYEAADYIRDFDQFLAYRRQVA